MNSNFHAAESYCSVPKYQKIDLNDLEFVMDKDGSKRKKVLGSGAFAIVYQAKYLETDVAVKKMLNTEAGLQKEYVFI